MHLRRRTEGPKRMDASYYIVVEREEVATHPTTGDEKPSNPTTRKNEPNETALLNYIMLCQFKLLIVSQSVIVVHINDKHTHIQYTLLLLTSLGSEILRSSRVLITLGL